MRMRDRFAISFEMEWGFNMGNQKTIRKFLIDGHLSMGRRFEKVVFWPRGWFRVCGLFVGFGLYWQIR